MYSNLKERILSAVPIESYVGRYVRLKSSGSTLKGLCPFHKEKTPSFTVSPTKSFFHCFGCGKGGDLFTFVMEIENIPFAKAIQVLAQYTGIDLEKEKKYTSKPSKHLERLLETNIKANKYFQDFLHSLEGKNHKNYLLKRGLTEQSIQDFSLGATPNSWNWLQKKLCDVENEALTLGLVKKKEEVKSKQAQKKNTSYDFFRERVTFPIYDVNQCLVGFGARTLGSKEKEAKYINSSDSILFKKKKLLYGLSKNITEIRKQQEIILVEGYLDVIGLSQHGMKNVCAPLGTAFSKEHLRILSRYTKKIIFLFDGDTAGLRASQKAVELALSSSELECFVCILPSGSDPFDFCQSRTLAQLKIYIEDKIDAINFYIMESMLPTKIIEFYEKTFSHKDKNLTKADRISNFYKDYYLGNLGEFLPQGFAKKGALENIYEKLRNFSKDTDKRLVLEVAAKLLKLNSTEIQKEFESQETLRENPSPYPKLKFISQPVENFPTQLQPKKKADNRTQLLVQCEQDILLELLFSPEFTVKHYSDLRDLQFQDMNSEFLWRHLETRFLCQKSWTIDNFNEMEIPEETRSTFIAKIIERKKTKNNPKVIEEYLLKHNILRYEKHIDEIRYRILVTDSIEKNDLIGEENSYLQKLTNLKEKWRSL